MKREIFRIVTCVVVLFWHLVIFGQAQPDPARPAVVIPPSPGVSSLLSDVNIPVGYYTGTVQFSLPLWTITSGNLSLPITLSYGASGLRVEDDAGLTGMGWTLNASGLIGLSSPASGKAGQLSYTQTANLLNMPDYSAGDAALQTWLNNLSACNKDLISKGNYNLMPDTYFLNFNGNNAKMFFDKSGNIFISPYKAWKVTRDATTGFTVVVENGTIYKFELYERTVTDISSVTSDYVAHKDANSAWFLTKIIAPDKNDTISFNYQPIRYTTSSKNPDETKQVFKQGQVDQFYLSPQQEIWGASTIDQTFETYMLSSIVSRNQRIDFVTSSGRLDIENIYGGNPYKLNSVKISSRVGSSVKVIKTFTFEYSYSNVGSVLPIDKRMFLSAWIEKAPDNQEKRYSFTYKNLDALPARNSKAQDHWGFYNKANNSTLIPKLAQFDEQLTDGADRNPYPTNADAGMLSNIVYPTGGSDSLEYEMHDYTYTLGSGPRGTDSSEVDQSLNANANGGTNYIARTFQVTFGQTIRLTYSLHQTNPNDGTAEISLMNISDPGNPISVFGAAGGGVNVTVNKFLTPGQYQIIAEKQISTESATIAIVYKKHVIPLINGRYARYAGGVRIKRILQFDGIDHSKDMVKKFVYAINDTISSGVLVNYPVYADIQYVPQNVDNTVVGFFIYFARNSSSQVGLGRTQGSNVGYTKVTILHGNSGENGKEEMYYNMPGDKGGVGYPYAPKSSFDDLRGLLTKKIIYDKDGSIIQKTNNEYEFNDSIGKPNQKWINGVKIGHRRTDVIYDAGSCPAGFSQFLGSSYKIYQFWPTLTATYDTLFGRQNNSISTLTKNYYDSPSTLLTKQDTYKSDNSLISKQFKYPKDFSSTSPYDEMMVRHIISPVVEQVQNNVTHSKELSKIRTNFQFWQGNVMIQPATVQRSFGGKSLDVETSLNNYDARGNVLQTTDKNGLIVSYLWGYNTSYPVAKIINASYSTASSYISQSILDNPTDDASLLSHLSNLRKIAGALVTTYTYAPLIGMTSETDPAGKTTFYEYDSFNRLKNIKDYQGNIIKNFQYNYVSSCGVNCIIFPLQTMNGSNTIGYPVGVFNVNNQFLANANSQGEYVNKWNLNATNQAKGVLSAGSDALHFNLTLAANQTAPTAVTGLRYYQIYLPFYQIDNIVNSHAVYVDFGDGTGMRLGKTIFDTDVTLAPNTVVKYFTGQFNNNSIPHFIHTYPNNNVKILTFYHNDAIENSVFDNYYNPGTSLTLLANLRGNLPQLTQRIGGSGYQQASMNSVANVTNWNSISSVTDFVPGNGDGVSPSTNMSYAQDFMANNKGLKMISTSRYGFYRNGVRDLNFKISRLKSNWNTYFTDLESLFINEDHWIHEDLSALKKLNAFSLTATTQDHTDNPINNAVVPLTALVMDNVIKQIWAGAGKAGVKNGLLSLYGIGPNLRTADSSPALTELLNAGWKVYINNVLQ